MYTLEEITQSSKHCAVLETKDPTLLNRLENPALYLRPQLPLADRFVIVSSLKKDVEAANHLLDGGNPVAQSSYLYTYVDAVYTYYTQYMNGDTTYVGTLLAQMAEGGFVQPFTSDETDAKEQFLKDILRGVKVNNHDIMDSLYVEDDILDGFLNDILTGSPSNIQGIQDRMIDLKHGYESQLAKAFLSDDKIHELITAKMLADISNKATDLPGLRRELSKHLVSEMLEVEHLNDVLQVIFPSLDPTQIMTIIKGHNQSLIAPMQVLIDPLLLNGAGYSLKGGYNVNIFVDQTTNDVRYRVSKDEIVLRKMDDPGMGDEVPLPGSITIEYVLGAEGFMLKDINISDSLIKKLVFAQSSEDMIYALKGVVS